MLNNYISRKVLDSNQTRVVKSDVKTDPKILLPSLVKGRQIPEKDPPTYLGPASLVIIKVGEKQVQYPVHKGLLCYISPYFDRCFNGAFAEAESKILVLEDVECEVFDLLQLWLYTSEIHLRSKPSLSTIAKLAILAQRALMADLQVEVLELLVTLFGHASMKPGKNTQDLFDFAMGLRHENPDFESSLMRSLIIPIAAKDYSGFKIWIEQLPHILIIQILYFLYRQYSNWQARIIRDRELRITHWLSEKSKHCPPPLKTKAIRLTGDEKVAFLAMRRNKDEEVLFLNPKDIDADLMLEPRRNHAIENLEREIDALPSAILPLGGTGSVSKDGFYKIVMLYRAAVARQEADLRAEDEAKKKDGEGDSFMTDV